MAKGKDLVSVAKQELAKGESGRPNTYTRWYGFTGEWCGMFVAYCANKAGIPVSVIPKTASVQEYLNFAKNNKRFKAKDSGYKPKAGDIMIMKSGGASHVGIVEKSANDVDGIFYTIEGNSSDAVKARKYNLSNKDLTGFLVPDYGEKGNILNEETKSTANDEVELCATIVKSTVTVNGDLKNKELYTFINGNSNEYELHIVNKGADYMPLVLKGVKWTTKWQDAPGELEFEIIKDSALDIQEGNSVIFRKGDIGIFYGFIFTKSREKDGVIKIKAYDQLRYLKNKDTYCYKNRTYDEIIKMIAADYRLTLGNVEKTGIPMSRVCDDEDFFSILKTARQYTKAKTGIDYVLFDDFGKLSLRNTNSLQTNYLINSDTGENFDYKTSIDDGVYNKVQLYGDDGKTGTREKYVYQDAELINKWGVLQATYKLENRDNPGLLGTMVLKALCNKKRELEVKGCIGDFSLRAGAKVFVNLDLGDIIYKNVNPIITRAVHYFNENHTCDLTLLGGEPYIGG